MRRSSNAGSPSLCNTRRLVFTDSNEIQAPEKLHADYFQEGTKKTEILLKTDLPKTHSAFAIRVAASSEENVTLRQSTFL